MPHTDRPTLTVIIPALNEAERIGPVLEAVGGEKIEIIVADGGSKDATTEIAHIHGARTIHTQRGRGCQLAAGAEAGKADWLLFLHADTRLSDDWRAVVFPFIADPQNINRAAVFRFRLDDEDTAARHLEKIVDWRTRTLGLPYGDQGLLMSRDFYLKLGGYRPLPLMEDVDMVRRIGARRITVLEADALTSATRYQTGGYLLRPLRNLLCLGLYFAGLPPRLIERLYR